MCKKNNRDIGPTGTRYDLPKDGCIFTLQWVYAKFMLKCSLVQHFAPLTYISEINFISVRVQLNTCKKNNRDIGPSGTIYVFPKDGCIFTLQRVYAKFKLKCSMVHIFPPLTYISEIYFFSVRDQ
jgi:hypothetical protein